MIKNTKIRYCPFCKKNYKNKLFLKKNIEVTKIDSYSFSSRKVPEFMNFNLLKCNKCSLIYANSIPNFKKIKKLYYQTNFGSTIDAKDAAKTYYIYLKKYLKLEKKNQALEIGAGNGIFMQYLQKLGFKKVIGVEPSKKAISFADKKIKKNILHNMFEQIKLKKNSFDLVCCFMTMEHVYEPSKTLEKSYNFLKKNGCIALVTHDCDNLLHKILKKKSPIIDIEHLQLFSKKSIRNALIKYKFKNVTSINIKNQYRISYWVNLLPFSLAIKTIILNIFKIIKLDSFKIPLNVGNILTLAKK